MPELQLHYVVLRHEGIADPHFDFMIETEPGSRLWSWRADQWPLQAGQRLIRIADHRNDYLRYEGAVSGGRGSVRRVAAGLVWSGIITSVPPRLSVELVGEPSQHFILEQDLETMDRWEVRSSVGA